MLKADPPLSDGVLHTPKEAAAILGMSEKTLAAHTRAGDIRSIIIGNGQVRKRRRYSDQNIASFIRRQKVREVPSCPSIKAPKAHSFTSIFKSEAVAFSALQKPVTKKTPKPLNVN